MVKVLSQQVDLRLFLRTILVIGVIVIFVGAGCFIFHKVKNTVWYKKQLVWHYVKKNSINRNFTANYDFNIKSSLETIKAGIAAATNQISIASSNVVEFQSKLSELRKEQNQIQNKIGSLKSRVSSIESELLSNQRRLTNQLMEIDTARSNVNFRVKVVEDLKTQLKDLQEEYRGLTNEIASSKGRLVGLQDKLGFIKKEATNVQGQIDDVKKQIDSLVKDVSQKESKASELRRQISSVSNTLLEKESSLKNHKNNLNLLETNLFNRQTNIVNLNTNSFEKRRELIRTAEELTNNEKQQERMRDDIRKLNDSIAEWRKKLSALQRELSQKEAEAQNQYRYFARDAAQRISTASSYAAIYHVIGEELWVAERLFKRTEAEKRIEGVKIAFDAMKHALDPAQNYWLAGRIAEAYLFPNIGLLKGTDSDRQVLEQIFSYSVNAFQNNEEDNNVINTYELHLANTGDEKRANTIRYYLSLQFEQKGELENAVYYLKQITDQTNFAYAVNRIPTLQARIDRLKKK
ncbi:MAG: hypothetical protein N2487_02880 [Verrucomicrobiae bacterium]|nr:hypothetical protein [Verrucomicrobiae bacterium]